MLHLKSTIISLAALLSGCAPAGSGSENNATAERPAMNDMAQTNMMMAAPGDSEPTREYKQAMMASMQNMPPFTGDPDRDFMQQMRVHHQAAIQMSETLLRHGKDQQTRALAQEIIAAQRSEIAEIDAWLGRPR